MRGTCWDFATVSVLEQSYRSQGIANGWLAPEEYVALSEQAYGEEILHLCSGNLTNRSRCYIEATKNTTEGGEAGALFFLKDGLKNSIFPNSICPYFPDAGNDTICPELTAETRSKNPLLFSMDKMVSLYDVQTIKKALVEESKAMAFSTPMPYITHYYPCIGDLVSDPRCNISSPSCTLCPPELVHSTCCIPIYGGENYNMDGEFIAHYGMSVEGGHAMTLVGFNDEFYTRDGFTGGFILKNSWFDGVKPPLGPQHARASHSISHWTQVSNLNSLYITLDSRLILLIISGNF